MAIVGLMGVTSKSVRLPVQKVQHGLAVATDLWFWTVCSGNALYPWARALLPAKTTASGRVTLRASSDPACLSHSRQGLGRLSHDSG